MIQIDMPMPDNCVECRFSTSEFGFCNAMPVEFAGRVNDCEEDGKPEWCPLKAQTPRVMTLEEVKNFNRNEVVWLEDIGKAEIIPGIVKGRRVWPFTTVQLTNFMRCDGCTITSYDGDYNIRWRAWTSLPTEEQREAASWE